MSGDSDDLVDWDAARSLTGGDDALLDEIVELFPIESGRHLDGVREAIAASDAERLERSAHTLKSAARMFGARAVVQLAEDVEGFGRESRVDAAEELLARLEEETARLVEALREGRGRSRGGGTT
ncbi:MAG: Hpt domain-containing protein [Pseudomonadales bacterium]